MPPSRVAVFFLAWAFLLPALASAQSASEKEARRQLAFARDEVSQRNFEKALASADSALRLHPALYDAFVYKALAYEGLGDLQRAEGYLVTYSDLTVNEAQVPEASSALDRIRDAATQDVAVAGGDPAAVARAAGDVAAADLPALPAGSESVTAWLLLQQRRRALEAQRNVGVAFLGAGAGLLGLGGGSVAGAAAASQTAPDDPNVESLHAAGLGSLFSGAVILAVGLPLTLASASQAAALKNEAAALKTAGRAPRLEVGPQGIALRFP